jgi:hypothetical protein
MGTNFYRIPTEREMKERKDRLHVRIIGLKLNPELIERGFSYIESVTDHFTRLSPWDEFIEGTRIHLGKRSSGWKFCWNFHEKKFYSNKEELFNFIRSGRVVDEYGVMMDTEEFIQMALDWDGLIFDEEYEKNKEKETGYLPFGGRYHDKVIDGLRVSTSTDFC